MCAFLPVSALFCPLVSMLNCFSAGVDARAQFAGVRRGGVLAGSPLHHRLSLCVKAACLGQGGSTRWLTGTSETTGCSSLTLQVKE